LCMHLFNYVVMPWLVCCACMHVFIYVTYVCMCVCVYVCIYVVMHIAYVVYVVSKGVLCVCMC